MALLRIGYLTLAAVTTAVSTKHFNRTMRDRFGKVTKPDIAVAVFYALILGVLSPALLVFGAIAKSYVATVKLIHRVTPTR
jgi:hypothetical protein